MWKIVCVRARVRARLVKDSSHEHDVGVTWVASALQDVELMLNDCHCPAGLWCADNNSLFFIFYLFFYFFALLNRFLSTAPTPSYKPNEHTWRSSALSVKVSQPW